MAARLSARERKLLELSPNQKSKKYGGLALEINQLVEELVNLQDQLIYRSFTNEVEDAEILEQKELIDEITLEVNALFNEVVGIKKEVTQAKAYVKGE